MKMLPSALFAWRQADPSPDQPEYLQAAGAGKTKIPLGIAKPALTILWLVFAFSILLGADLYLHRKHEINLWGYRGPAVGRKRPGEKRIIVLGGSTAWGYGLAEAQSFPAQLQQRLTERPGSTEQPIIKVVNLAAIAEGAYALKYTLHDYDYLDYDVALIYSGASDLWGPDLFLNRRRSSIFIRTGYLPLLPSLTADKIDLWRNRRRTGAQPIVMAPPGENESNDRERLNQLIGPGPSSPDSVQVNYPRWQFYCEQIFEATEIALKRGKRVLIVSEPYLNDIHIEQQRTLEDLINRRFAGQGVRYLNLGRTLDMKDRSLSWDGLHLTAEGNRAFQRQRQLQILVQAEGKLKRFQRIQLPVCWQTEIHSRNAVECFCEMLDHSACCKSPEGSITRCAITAPAGMWSGRAIH